MYKLRSVAVTRTVLKGDVPSVLELGFLYDWRPETYIKDKTQFLKRENICFKNSFQ